MATTIFTFMIQMVINFKYIGENIYPIQIKKDSPYYGAIFLHIIIFYDVLQYQLQVVLYVSCLMGTRTLRLRK